MVRKHGQAANIAVVEDFDDLRPLVAEAEIGLVEDERAAERVEGVEDRRYRRSAAREEALVAERADREERAGLPASVIPSQPEVRQLVEGVIEPGQKDVVRGDVLERLAEIHVPVNELPYVRDELRLAPVYPRLAGKQHDLILDQVVVRRERHELRVGSEIDRVLQRPPTGAIDRKQRPPQVRAEYHLNDRAVIENRRCRRHDPRGRSRRKTSGAPSVTE